MEKWVQWRDSIYEVSNTGKVRNKNTKKEIKQHKKHSGKYENDYMHVNLYIKGEDKTKSVHRLVAECYLENYREELEVNHKNNLRYDNRVENIEMCNKEYNYQYSIEKGKGSARVEVYCIDKEGNRLDFKSLWEASKYLIEKKGLKGTKDSLSNLISRSCRGKILSIGGYYWYYKNNNEYDEKPRERKKKKGYFSEKEKEEIEKVGLNEGIVKRRIVKYNMEYEEALKLKKGKQIKEKEMKEIDPNSKLYKGMNKRFGRLVVKEIIREKGRNAKYRCVCDCGKEIITWYNNLYLGKTLSCGCLKKNI